MRKMERPLALLLAALLCIGLAALEAHADPKAIDVLPGAFGEAIDDLDSEMIQWCIGQGDLALEKLLDDYARSVEESARDGYLQILQTTLLLPGQQPSGASDIQREVWQAAYGDTACVVSFVFIDNGAMIGDVPYAEHTGQYGDYAVRKDGTVTGLSLRAIRARYFHDPVLPGVRVINMGSHYNGIFTIPAGAGKSGLPLFEYLNDPALAAFVERFEGGFPVSASVRRDGEAGGAPTTAADPEPRLRRWKKEGTPCDP